LLLRVFDAKYNSGYEGSIGRCDFTVIFSVFWKIGSDFADI